jgi:uncharacterized repeat protein (TIGR01451 family)
MGAYEAALVDLEIVKTADPAVFGFRGAITYTLVFSNAGSLPTMGGVVISDQIPAEVLVTEVLSSGVLLTDSHTVPAYVWQGPELAPGAGGQITIAGELRAWVQGAFDLENQAIITTAGEFDPADNVSVVSSRVRSFAIYMPLVVRGG